LTRRGLREKILSSSSIFFFIKATTLNFEQTKFKFKSIKDVALVPSNAHFLMADFKINKADDSFIATSLMVQTRLSLFSTLFSSSPSSFVIQIDDFDNTLLPSAVLQIEQ
jgi:hypothetical protein